MTSKSQERVANGEPESVEEALARAAAHGRAAAAEIVASLRAVLDAASLLASGAPGSEGRLSPLALALDHLHGVLAEDGGNGALTSAVTAALDAEIARWEELGRDDPDARAVLRAFLGLRELLWELGLRGRDAADAGSAKPRRRRDSGGRKGRLERVPVEG